MKHKVKLTVLRRECYSDLQEEYTVNGHKFPQV